MTAEDKVTIPLAVRVARGILRSIETLIGRTSPVGDRHFFETEQFSWVAAMEASYPDIARELSVIMNDLADVPAFEVISTDQKAITNDGRWKTYFFRGYGVDFPPNCRACPMTWEALGRIPGMTTAFFSILEPGKQIPPHRGPYKGVLRYHLGLVVPQRPEGAWIEVGGERRHWRNGGSLIFDDSFAHRAGNDTDEVRVVLFVDFIRPLPAPVSWLNALIINLISRSPYVQEGKRNSEDWQALVARRKASR